MRECNSPEPQYGGRKCIGKAGDSDSCNKKVCPIGEYKSLLVNLNRVANWIKYPTIYFMDHSLQRIVEVAQLKIIIIKLKQNHDIIHY